MKNRSPESHNRIRVDGGQVVRRQYHGAHEHDQQVETKFLAAPVVPEPTPQGVVVQREIGAGDQHEQDDDPLHKPAVMRDRGVFRGKTARGHRAEGVAKRVEQIHACQQQSQRLEGADQGVHRPQDFGRLTNSRRQLLRHRSRDFGFVELHAADSQHGQDGKGKHDDAHAAKPVRETAPEQHAVRQ